MDEFERFLRALMDEFNRIDNTECDGRGENTVSKGVKDVMDEIKDFFDPYGGDANVPGKQCVNRFCSVRAYAQNY